MYDQSLLQGRIKACRVTRFPVTVNQGLLRLANYRVSSTFQRKLSLVNDGGTRSLQYISRADRCTVKLFARRLLKSKFVGETPTPSNTKWEYSFEINDGGEGSNLWFGVLALSDEGVYIRTYDIESLEAADDKDPQMEYVENLESIQKRIGSFMTTLNYSSIT